MDILRNRVTVFIILLGILLILTTIFAVAEQQENLIPNPEEVNNVIIILKNQEEKPSFLNTLTSTAANNKNNKNKTLEEIKEEIKETQEEVIGNVLNNPKKVQDVNTFKTINAISAKVSADKLEELQKHPEVESVIPNVAFELFMEDTIPLINASETHNTTVNSINITGKGVGVCIVDTGIDPTHPDLKDNIVGQACFCDNNEPCCNNNETSEIGNATDTNGHGTHVSGSVGANAVAAGLGNNLVGVAKEASITSVKVFGKDKSTFLSNILNGIDFCVNNKDNYSIQVITMSLGTGLFSTADACDDNPSTSAFTNAVNTAYSQGITVTASSGNDGATSGISLPGCLSNVTSVGSTTKSDDISAFTNRAAILDILAPGQSINSTAQHNCPAGGSGQSCSNNRYTTLSGTSMAAPHAAGHIALAQHAAQLYYHRNLSVDEVRALLRNTGKSINDSGGTGLIFPRINSLELIQTIEEPVKYNIFKEAGKTTNFSALTYDSLETVTNAHIEGANGLIVYNGSVNFLNSNLNDSISISQDQITINANKELQLNNPVSITFYNQSITNPTILENGSACTDCAISELNANNVTFTTTSINGDTTFSLGASAALDIFDSTDAQGGNTAVGVDDDMSFYANYTNTSGTILLNASCNITLNNATSVMTYNTTQQLYEHKTFFTTQGNQSWNVSCGAVNKTSQTGQDNASIQALILGCKEYNKADRAYTLTANISANISTTCVSLEADNLTFDCNSNSIVNTNSISAGTGIRAKNVQEFVVKNCNIQNFNRSLFFDNATSTVINQTTTNGQIAVNGSGGGITLNNVTHTSLELDANTTSTVTPKWYITVNTQNNNSQALETNATLTSAQSTATTQVTTGGKTLFLTSEGSFKTSTTYHTPHKVTVIAENYTTTETTINLTQTKSTNVALTLSMVPATTEFNGNTTDFSAISEIGLGNVTNITIDKKGQATITFIGSKNARGRHFDNAIQINEGMVSVNTSILSNEYNNNSMITLYNVTCPSQPIASDGIFSTPEKIRATGFVCDANTSTACTQINCSNETLSFMVNHFSSFTFEANAEISLLSDSDANNAKKPNETVTFQINYINSTSNDPITDAVCLLTIANTTVFPSYNASSNYYEYRDSFVAAGSYHYNATCDSILFTKLQGENSFTLTVVNSSSNSGSGGSGSSSGSGSSGGGGGGGGGGSPVARPAIATNTPTTPATTTSLANTPSDNAAPSTNDGSGNGEGNSDGGQADTEQTATDEQAVAADAGDDKTGLAGALTGQIAGVGKALKLIKDDGSFSLLGLITLTLIGAALIGGVGSLARRRIGRFRSSDGEAMSELETEVKVGMGSFGWGSNAMSWVKNKINRTKNVVQNTIPGKKEYLFDEKDDDKKFEF